ncbi:unnamed protein product, partial [Vitis vinifera]|uniref:Uncharacterized protein n=1 Tax=Vitis vinifera TaxID=29760 RepID=D7SI83_VITVI
MATNKKIQNALIMAQLERRSMYSQL